MKTPMTMTMTSALLAAIVVAAACGSDEKGSHSTQTQSGGGSGNSGSEGGAAGSSPDDAYAGASDAPKITQIPIPPNCQHPGFPGGDQHYDFDAIRAQLIALKPGVEARQAALLAERYDLADIPSPDVRMTRGKPIQIGVRVRLPAGQTWESLAELTAQQLQEQDLFPAGFYPLPHPNHQLGGQLFTHFVIDELKRQTGGFRDLTRFDLDFDLPDHVLPEFPPAMFLTNHIELGDVSQGQVVTTQNFYELFKGILNPKELEGLRLLLTPFPQQEFNLTDDRRSNQPSFGVACFDCHINGHTTGSIEILPDDRPQPFRRRGDTVSLRGVAINQLFGSKRAIMTVEDFSKFEQRTAYFDDDITQANKKGKEFLDDQDQIQGMAEIQRLLDFPPAPKLDVLGRLDPALATPAELRGEELFHGKAKCGACHVPPFYLDNLMHDLKLQRFYVPRIINCRAADPDGPIKTFTLRGIKESPPYLHDGRLLTLDDVVEFFNLVLGTKLTRAEKADLLAFLYTL
ncbi:MAG: cytochrome B6 [Myxococcota bacterium]